MRVGLVCPYSLDVPGGVQYHVRDLADFLRSRGHEAEILAPGDDDAFADQPHLTTIGRAVPVRYNGSVARVSFGPTTAARVRRWVDAGDFDVLHLHEPITPSASILALWASQCPVVATFHTSIERSRALHAAAPLLRGSLERILGRIAVSPEALRTLRTHLGGDAVVIPNGVDTAAFARARPRPEWVGCAARPTIVFLGRADEPRKGLPVLVAAMDEVLARWPGARLFIAGPNATAETLAELGASERVNAATVALGRVSEADKAALLASADVYVAPQTGGESFGIVLVEAMAAGAAVVASDLVAFRDVLGGGAVGSLFAVGDATACAAAIGRVLDDPVATARRAQAATEHIRRYDWSVVGQSVLAVYDTVLTGVARTTAVGEGR